MCKAVDIYTRRIYNTVVPYLRQGKFFLHKENGPPNGGPNQLHPCKLLFEVPFQESARGTVLKI